MNAVLKMNVVWGGGGVWGLFSYFSMPDALEIGFCEWYYAERVTSRGQMHS